MRYLTLLTLLAGCVNAPAFVVDQVDPEIPGPVCDKPPAEPHHLKLGAIERGEGMVFFVSGLADEIKAHSPLVIIDIDSPGGSVGLGLGIISAMRDAHADGMTFECRIAPGGMAASMAAVIFETGCNKRVMHRDSALLFHEPSISDDESHNEGDLRLLANQLADMGRRLAIMTAPHLKMTADQYVAWVHNRDRWMDVAEAKARGALDEIIP